MSAQKRKANSKQSFFRGKATVTGRVTAERTGKPIAGAQVTATIRVFDASKGWPPVAEQEVKGTTDDRGRYEITVRGVRKLDENAFHVYCEVFVSAQRHVPERTMPGDRKSQQPYAGKRLRKDIQLKPAFALRGRVLDEKGRPIEGVEVLVYQSSSYGCCNPSLVGGDWPVTDADGRFLADGMPMGLPSEQRQVVGFFHNDYVRRFVQRIGDLPRNRKRVAELGDIVLGKGLSLSGTVRDTRGRPVAGAEVLVVAEEPYEGDPGCARPPAKWDIKTGADGRYKAAGLPPMVYHVMVTYDSHPPGSRMDVKLMTRSRSGVDVVLDKKSGALAGTVTHADGTPAAGLELHADQYTSGVRQTITTNKLGRYKLEGFAPHMAVYFEGDGEMEHIAWFDPPNRQADIRLPKELTVTGRLVDATTGKPVAGKMRYKITPSPYWGQRQETSASRSGVFTISGVPTGRAYLCVRPTNCAVTCRQVDLKASTCDLGDIPVYRSVTLEGTILTPSGKPIKNAEVFIDGPHLYDGESTRTNAKGRYVFKDIWHAPHQFRVRAEGFAPYYEQSVELPAESGRLVKDVRMARGVAIRGRVMDGKTPVDRQIVILSARRIRGRFVKRPWIADTSTTDTGEFVFPHVRPGKYLLRCGLEQRNITVKAGQPLTCNFRWPGRYKMPPHQSKGGHVL
jgi:protocatechuate 3,4-dioxygenase beta subunit